MLMFFGRMRFTVDGVSAAAQLVDDAAEAMTNAAGQFFGRVVRAVNEDGEEFFRLRDTLIKG